MELLKVALANLVALEARYHELVDAPGAIAQAVREVVIHAAAEVQKVDALAQSLEARLKQVDEILAVIAHAPAIEADVGHLVPAPAAPAVIDPPPVVSPGTGDSLTSTAAAPEPVPELVSAESTDTAAEKPSA